jgi:hypothetical protein
MPRPATAATGAPIRAHVSRAHRAAASTARRSRSRPRAFAPWAGSRPTFGSVRRVNPFWFVGGAAALWAIFLTFALGLRREDFPRTDGQARTVMLISVALVAGAIGSAIYGGISGAGDNHGFRHGPEAKHAK